MAASIRQPSSKMNRIAYFLLLLLTAQGLWANDPEAEIPFQIINEHIFFKLSVNGGEPLDFVFDTGAAGNVMDEQTAKVLGLEMNGSQVVQGASGSTSIERTTGHEMQVEGIDLRGIDFMVMDLGHLADEDAPIDGIVGASILNRYTVELNYDEHVIKLYKKRTYEPDESWEKQRMSLQGFGIPIVSATITLPSGETLEGPYLVDTGAATTVKFNTPFVNGNGLIDKMGKHYAYSSQTLSKTATDEVSKLSSYEVFGHKFEDFAVRLSQGTRGVSALTQVDGILGLSILKRFNTVYDYYNQVMYLQPSKYYEERFHINHDGMKIEKKNGAFEVTAVFDGSVAEEQGIKNGDIILSLDGDSDFTRHSFHHYIEKAQKAVSIQLRREGKVITLSLEPRSML